MVYVCQISSKSFNDVSIGFYWIDARGGGASLPIKVYCKGYNTCLYPDMRNTVATYNTDDTVQKFSQIDNGYRVRISSL